MDIAQAAKIMGATVKALQRWEREGKLVPAARTPESQVRAALDNDHAAGAPDQD